MRAFLILLLSLVCTGLHAQDFYGKRAEWLKKAEDSKVVLTSTIRKPIGIVRIVKDESAFQGWKAVADKPIDSLYDGVFKKKSGVIVDFGEHLTGNFSFTIQDTRGVADAPVRFKFTFAEVPAEAVTPFDPYTGGLSRAWLQDEIVTISEVPVTHTIDRRVAFRYVKIELIGSSRWSDFKISNVELKATTSVASTPAGLREGTDALMSRIDEVGLKTLKECMQTVYEDGPKRDRRLWIGDLYLESLANTYSFKNHQLTKHCLYLLAALSNKDGYLNGNVFERPEPHPQQSLLFDYALLYNVALREYFAATNDKETALDLWPVLKKQIEIPKKYMAADGTLDAVNAAKDYWLFIDWRDELNKEGALYGVVIYAYQKTYDLAKSLGKESEVAELPGLIKKLTAAARKNLYDRNQKLFVSGPDRQVSYASQAWMILSGVTSGSEAVAAMKGAANNKNVVFPGAPYLYHYVIEAMIQCGMKQEAKDLLVSYWGGMVNKGADTFWEVYDPKNDFLSPYNSFVVNSYCHAWSCTPVYFIRKYPEIFQAK